MNKLIGKVAIVTGGSRGIGRAIALELGREGASIVINYSKSDIEAEETINMLKEEGIIAYKVKEDIGSFEGAKRVVEFTISKFGKIDILINNAARSIVGLFLDSTKEEIDNIIDINLKGPLYLTKHALPHMIGRNTSIVNISSIWGDVGASCEVLYSSSKGGINLFTKALAKEMAASNIRVNAIAPGVINTKMNDFLDEEEKNSLVEEIPLGRFGDAREIGRIAVFLCSDDSSYITGQVIRADGAYI